MYFGEEMLSFVQVSQKVPIIFTSVNLGCKSNDNFFLSQFLGFTHFKTYSLEINQIFCFVLFCFVVLTPGSLPALLTFFRHLAPSCGRCQVLHPAEDAAGRHGSGAGAGGGGAGL